MDAFDMDIDVCDLNENALRTNDILTQSIVGVRGSLLGDNYYSVLGDEDAEGALDDFDDPSAFTNLGLNNNYCFNKEDNHLDLEGYFDEPSMKFAVIELFLCNNASNDNKCQSFEDMNKNLNGKSFNIYFEDIIFDTAKI